MITTLARFEECPKCTHKAWPTDTPMAIPAKGLRIPFWRYECGQCTWVWANELQRTHNDNEYNRTLQYLTASPYGG